MGTPRSSTKDGATLTDAPAALTLTFSEPVELRFSTFKVYPLPVEAALSEDQVGDPHGKVHHDPQADEQA